MSTYNSISIKFLSFCCYFFAYRFNGHWRKFWRNVEKFLWCQLHKTLETGHFQKTRPCRKRVESIYYTSFLTIITLFYHLGFSGWYTMGWLGVFSTILQFPLSSHTTVPDSSLRPRFLIISGKYNTLQFKQNKTKATYTILFLTNNILYAMQLLLVKIVNGIPSTEWDVSFNSDENE